jgi:hypothetical protein
VTKSQGRDDWVRATLGSAVRDRDPITVWCNYRACGYWLETGHQYRTVLTVADLSAYAERYGPATTFIDFRTRLRCRHCGSGDVSTIVDWHYKTPGERWRDGSDPL